MKHPTFPVPSIRDRVSDEEWRATVDLAACYRLFDLYELSDLTANHISCRVPGEQAFLINPYGMLYEEITASSLIKLNAHGDGSETSALRDALPGPPPTNAVRR